MAKIGKVYNLIHLDYNIRAALVVFHPFTGNKCGKQACFKVMKQCGELINDFILLGGDWEINAELTVALDSFVSHSYGYKAIDINKVRKKIIDKKFVKAEKVMDLSFLPPCQSTLYLRILRYNYVARIKKCSLVNVVECPSIMENGWMEDGETVWVDDAFPEDMEILVDKDFDK